MTGDYVGVECVSGVLGDKKDRNFFGTTHLVRATFEMLYMDSHA